VLGAGAVAVPLNPSSPIRELDRELRTARTSLVLVSSGEEVLPEGFAAGGASLPAREGDELTPIAEREVDDPAALLFTSATAGPPKAAILTHGSLLANIEQMELRVGLGATADDIGLLVVPPFHILGLNVILGVQLYAGSRLVLIERFEPARALELIAEERVTILAGVPQIFSALADVPGATGDELTTVRLACSGAAPLDPAVARKFEERFGVKLWQGYGLTVASPAVTFPDLHGLHDSSSVGLPLPGVEVRVVDADGNDVVEGDPRTDRSGSPSARRTSSSCRASTSIRRRSKR
jgi:long-chain acyl-CoA synthetase